MKGGGQAFRVGAGLTVLVLLAAMAVRLLPPYLENWKLQSYLNHLAEDPAAAAQEPEIIRAKIVNQAGTLGLPVHGNDVRVTHARDTFSIEVLYVVRVDLPAYTVDLHFRPRAGGA